MEPDIPLDLLRAKAQEVGFDDLGVCAAVIPDEDIAEYKAWLAKGFQGNLAYMENEIRCSPQTLFPGAVTAVIFVTNYKQQNYSPFENQGLIASYARGKDYHNIHRSRLKKIIRWMEEHTGKQGIAKGFSDSTPVLEKALAVQAGLGWFGKNTLLIHRRFGTFTLLSGLFTSLSIAHTTPPKPLRLPRCGTCTRCLDACPTSALVAPYRLDAARCLSYHLIESKTPLPQDVQNKNPGYLFGCDICQDVCPHNVRSPLSLAPEFAPNAGMGARLTDEKLTELEANEQLLYGTPLKRRGITGLRHTMETLKKTN